MRRPGPWLSKNPEIKEVRPRRNLDGQGGPAHRAQLISWGFGLRQQTRPVPDSRSSPCRGRLSAEQLGSYERDGYLLVGACSTRGIGLLSRSRSREDRCIVNTRSARPTGKGRVGFLWSRERPSAGCSPAAEEGGRTPRADPRRRGLSYHSDSDRQGRGSSAGVGLAPGLRLLVSNAVLFPDLVSVFVAAGLHADELAASR